MKITAIESLHCDAGWRNFSFCKITTDEGLIGYSEYNESYGAKGVSGVIDKLSPTLLGRDPLRHEQIFAGLYASTRQAPGGINAQAIAALENALLDIKGKALGVPVHQLLGGAVRERLRLYWSHCGTYRMNEESASQLGKPPLQSLNDIEKLGAEIPAAGLTALKTNLFVFDGSPRLHMPGFAWDPQTPEVLSLNAERNVISAVRDQIEALRAGAGPDVDILLDLNFNFKIEGYLKIIRALQDLDIFWFELDMFDPKGLNLIRRSTQRPIASCESLYGLREFRPYFEHQSMDVAIIDVPWNGIWQSYKIACMADAYEVNVAPHNFYGHFSTLMSAHLCAALPNFRIMEIDIDDVPWKDDLVTEPPVIENGHMQVPDRPGWGAELNEDVVRAHPPRN